MDGAGELKTSLARLIRALLPEISGVRTTVRARVTAVHSGGGRVTELEPRYSVDVQPLDRHGDPDANLPELPDVPLPVLWAGSGRGLYAVPAIGAIVRIGFEYGDQSRPYVESLTGEGYSAPASPQGHLIIAGSGARIEISASGDVDVIGGTVRVSGGRVVLAGGGAAVVTTAYMCPFTELPHGGGSSSVEAAP